MYRRLSTAPRGSKASSSCSSDPSCRSRRGRLSRRFRPPDVCVDASVGRSRGDKIRDLLQSPDIRFPRDGGRHDRSSRVASRAFLRRRELATRYRWIAGYPRWFTIGAEKMRLEHYTRKAFDAASDVIPRKVLAQRDAVWRRQCARLPFMKASRRTDALRRAHWKLVPHSGRKDGPMRLAMSFARHWSRISPTR